MYLPPPPGETRSARLDRCDGTRIVEGEAEPCARLCLAHYDGNRYDVYDDQDRPYPGSDYWAPYPNEVLATPHQLRATELVRTWEAEMDSVGGSRSITMFRTSLFLDQDDRVVQRWLVATTELSSWGHLVCAFADELAARRWAVSCAES